MSVNKLLEEIDIELELIESILREVASLQADTSGRKPSVREKTATAAFLAQFYGGIENILKRISRFHNIPIPTGDTWHIDLFKRFASPGYKSLPVLFDESLAADMAPFRKFRHVVYHGYGFQLDWDRMQEGIARVEDVYSRFKARLFDYLQTIVKV